MTWVTVVSGVHDVWVRRRLGRAARARWEAHPVHELHGDLADTTLGTASYQIVHPDGRTQPVPDVSHVVVRIEGDPVVGRSVELELVAEHRGMGSAPQEWTPACEVPFFAVVTALLEGEWPPVSNPVAWALPVPDTDELPEGGHEIGMYQVDRWYERTRIARRRTVKAVREERLAGLGGRARWRVARERDRWCFRVALASFAWRVEVPWLEQPLWVRRRRTWLEAPVDAEGWLTTPRVMSSAWVGEVEDADPQEDWVDEAASMAWGELAESGWAGAR